MKWLWFSGVCLLAGIVGGMVTAFVCHLFVGLEDG